MRYSGVHPLPWILKGPPLAGGGFFVSSCDTRSRSKKGGYSLALIVSQRRRGVDNFFDVGGNFLGCIVAASRANSFWVPRPGSYCYG